MAYLSRIWCRLFHRRELKSSSVYWNGSRKKWMLWCRECGDWREAGQARLEPVIAEITDVAHRCETGACGRSRP